MASKAKTTQQAPDTSGELQPDGEANAVRLHPPLAVRASVPRRYRGGIAFGAEPVVIPASTLTVEQLQAIVDDPFLGVVELKGAEED